MIRRPPRPTRTDTLFPYTTLCRSAVVHAAKPALELLAPVARLQQADARDMALPVVIILRPCQRPVDAGRAYFQPVRSEEHTSELQSLMRISYAVFCLQKKTQVLSNGSTNNNHTAHIYTLNPK